MPNWSGTVLTNKGLALQAKVEAGTVMNITKLKIGDGILSSGQTVAALNDLVLPKKIIDISALTPLENGICKILGVVTNDGIESGFYVRELGVFAQDPDVGEILYAYTSDGSPDYLPAEGGPVAISEELIINLVFSNTATITANIAMDGLVTVNVLNNAINVHNLDEDAHAAAINKHNTSLTAHKDLLHLWKPNTPYAVGDIAYSAKLPSWAYLECVQAGTTAATEPTWPAVGNMIADGGVTWIVRDKRVADDSTDNSTKIVTTSQLRSNIQSLVSSCIAAVATAAGFSYSLNENGYIKFPSWLAGITFQWGRYSSTGTGARTVPVTLPVAFSASHFHAFAVDIGTGCYPYGASPTSLTTTNVYIPTAQIGTTTTPAVTGNATFHVFAIGN